VSEWYFAYGSNLWMEQVVARTGLILPGDHRPRIARLADYRLVFNMQDGPGEVFANIVPGGDGVVGVVYRLGHDALDRMDRYEQGYLRTRVHVSIQDGDLNEVVTYVADSATVVDGGRPSAEYLRRIVTGARQHGLPEEYIRSLLMDVLPS
jgi:gamma-glutamylcyclotransferase